MDKDNVEAGRVTTLGERANFGEKGSRKSRHIGAKEPILARRAAATWLAKRLVRRPDSKVKSLHKVDGLIEILYISEENVDEDPRIRVSVKDEG